MTRIGKVSQVCGLLFSCQPSSDIRGGADFKDRLDQVAEQSKQLTKRPFGPFPCRERSTENTNPILGRIDAYDLFIDVPIRNCDPQCTTPTRDFLGQYSHQ